MARDIRLLAGRRMRAGVSGRVRGTDVPADVGPGTKLPRMEMGLIGNGVWVDF